MNDWDNEDCGTKPGDTEPHGQNTYDSSSLPHPTALFSTNNDHSGYSSAEISQNFDQGSYQNDQLY